VGLGSHGCACVISGTVRSRCDVMFPCVAPRKNEAINVITLKRRCWEEWCCSQRLTPNNFSARCH